MTLALDLRALDMELSGHFDSWSFLPSAVTVKQLSQKDLVPL
jgi:hypothetical protein